MKFNDFVKSALSNDIVCIMDDVYRGDIIEKPDAAFRWIDSSYSEKEIDRFTIIPRIDGCKGEMLAVSLKN